MPAIMVTDAPFMRNKNCHAYSDTLDRPDHHRIARTVQRLYAFAQLRG